MPDLGGLIIANSVSGRGLRPAYRRPAFAPLLLGRDSDEAELWTGRLHGLCAAAHRIAFARAIDVGGTEPPSSGREAARELLLLAEQTDGYARRIALEFTRVVGASALSDGAAAVMRATVELRRTIGLERARGELRPSTQRTVAADDLVTTFAAIVDRQPVLPDLLVERLSHGARRAVRHAWAAPQAFLAYLRSTLPTLIEVIEPEAALAPVYEVCGTGRAATHRGALTYEVVLVAGYVTGIAWTTPTDRAFADGGIAARLLRDVDPTDEAGIELLMTTLDPCVPWSREAGELA